MDQLNEVVKYILYKSRENNTPVTEIMATFIAQVIYNPRTKRFYLEDRLSQSELRQLKEQAIKKIYTRDSAQMKTIELQITYDTEFLDAELKKQQKTRESSMESGRLIDEAVDLEVKNAKDFEGLTQLYKKIFNFLLFKNKQLTDPQQLQEHSFKIQKEVAAALETVIPRAALGPFVNLNRSVKITELVEMSNLIIGIRLFNQEIGKGGASLALINDLVNYEGRRLHHLTAKQLQQVTQLCENYSAIFKAQQHGKIKLTPNEFKRYKNQLTFLRQYNSFLTSLEQEIEASENQIDINENKFRKEMNDLKNLLGSRASAPKEQVYPRFAILYQSYAQLYEEKKNYEMRVSLYNTLTEFRKTFPLTLPQSVIKNAVSQLDSIRGAPEGELQDDPDSGVERFIPSTSADFMQRPCDYLGFCIWTIVQRNGLLVPGQPNLGVYKYKNKNCVFSSMKAVNEFYKDPEMYISSVLNVCRQNPQLIRFLGLDEQFKNVKLGIVSQVMQGEASVKNKLMLDKDIQTPVHFVQRNFDPNYFWNEWQLRKKAIQMANIRKNQTKASQTILSNFRVESDTQTFLKKDIGTNTMGSVGVQFRGQRQMKKQ